MEVFEVSRKSSFCLPPERYQHAGYWKNGTWNTLAPAISGTSAEVYAVCIQNGILYAAGSSEDASGYKEPGYWKDGTWTALPRETANTDGYVLAIAVSGNDVHAAGTVKEPTGSYDLGAYWKNGVLVTYAHGTNNHNVTDIAVNGSDVYVSGTYSDGSTEIGGYWKNGLWTVPVPLHAGESTQVNTIAFFGSDLVLGGKCDPNPGEAVKWTNGVVSVLDSVRPYESWVYDGAVSEGILYLAGAYNASADSPDLGDIPCYWKDGTVVLLSKPDVSGLRTGGLSSRSWITVSGTLVYMAGAIRDDDNGGSNPYTWRDGVRTQLQTQAGNLYHYVYGIALD